MIRLPNHLLINRPNTKVFKYFFLDYFKLSDQGNLTLDLPSYFKYLSNLPRNYKKWNLTSDVVSHISSYVPVRRNHPSAHDTFSLWLLLL